MMATEDDVRHSHGGKSEVSTSDPIADWQMESIFGEHFMRKRSRKSVTPAVDAALYDNLVQPAEHVHPAGLGSGAKTTNFDRAVWFTGF